MEEGDGVTPARAEDVVFEKDQGLVGKQPQVAEATQRLGFALAFLKKTLHSGEGALLRDHLLPFLPPLLQLQVSPPHPPPPSSHERIRATPRRMTWPLSAPQ